MTGLYSPIRLLAPLIALGLKSTIAMLLLLIAPAAPVAAQRLKLSVKQHHHCLLLTNGNVLFGDAHQLGEFVIVRTGPDDELRLRRSEVACWAKSLADLYQYRLDHRGKDNLESHLTDARWCMQYELFDQAAVEIEAAKAISPNHRSVRLLEQQLQREREPAKRSIGSVSTTNFVQDANPNDIGQANRIDPMTLRGFASQVQPMLINRCGRCHDQRSNLDWRLTVPAPGTRATSPITRSNLAASLRFIDSDHPGESVLLIKATSPHGGTDTPLSARNAKAIDAFKRWLMHTSKSVRQQRFGQTKRKPNPDRKVASSADRSSESGSMVATVSFTSDVPAGPTTPVGSPIDSDQPKRLPSIANPFDPSLFNRRFHRRDE